MEPYVALFGRHLKAARKARRITQPQLAERLGLSWHTVSKWERGESFPSADSMNGLADALMLDAGIAFTLRDSPVGTYDPRPQALIDLDRLLATQPDRVVRLVLALARAVVEDNAAD